MEDVGNMTREAVLDLALRHMVNCRLRRWPGQTRRKANKWLLSYLEGLDGRSKEARAFKSAVARRMSFVSE